MIEKSDIIKVLLPAAEKSFMKLFKEYHGEKFYYCTLVMLEAGPPCISALSYEALEELVSASDDRDAYSLLKWSYAESPYFAFGVDEYFGEVAKMFELSFYNEDHGNEDEGDEEEILCWLDSMEEVMKRLDDKGIFGMEEERDQLFIGAEIMPPVPSNFDRARRLNPDTVYNKWYQDWRGELLPDKPAVDWNEIWNPQLCSVILKSSVTDKKTVLQIKKALNISKGLTLFIEECKNAPVVILENESYSFVINALNKFPLIQPLLEVKKHKRSR